MVTCLYPTPLTDDLLQVIRQGSFIQKMVDLGWTTHDRFSARPETDDPTGVASVHVLVRSIARYHAFLDLMSSTVMFFVPTIVS